MSTNYLFSSEKPINGEEMAISRVGKELYEMLIRPYTKKQWDKYPKVSSSSGPVAKTSFTRPMPWPLQWPRWFVKDFMFRSLTQKCLQDFHTEKTAMIGDKPDGKMYDCERKKYEHSYLEPLEPRYFDDPWQHLPKDGYTRMFENMLLKVWLWGDKGYFFTFSPPGPQDHSQSGNRLLPGAFYHDQSEGDNK